MKIEKNKGNNKRKLVWIEFRKSNEKENKRKIKWRK